MRLPLGRLESIYTHKDIICVESVQHCVARFVCNDYCPSSSVNTMLSNLGWQVGWKITDLTMFLKINVQISFPNDLCEVHCVLSDQRQCTAPIPVLLMYH